jgi:PAS domain S-box-containing protein
VLVIDDNRAIQEDFRKILGGERPGAGSLGAAAAALFDDVAPVAPSGVAAGFEVDTADQGEQGLALARQALAEGRPYAMAFVDGRMPPGWDGVETIEHLWRACPDLQVVLCTAYSDYSWNTVVRRLGFSDRLVILKKPFENVEALQLATALSEKSRLLALNRAHVYNLETVVAQRTAELRRSEERHRLIAENAADLIGIVTSDGRLIYHSPSCERILGYTADEFAREGLFAIADKNDRAALMNAVYACIEQGTTTTCEFRARSKRGQWITLESRNAPFRGEQDVIEGALFVARDIGERRMIELQLRQAQKLESIGQLAAGVAHELNTPAQFIGDNVNFLREAFDGLASVLAAYGRGLAAGTGLGLVEMVRAAEQACDAEYLLTEAPRALAQTLEGVERMTRILRAMRDFSHPGSAQKEPVDLNEAIESTIAVSRHEWKHVAEVVTQLAPDLPRVPALPGELKQVFLNLVINAAHAVGDARDETAGTRGRITITTRRVDDSAEIRVADTGTGIPDEIRERIFEPFFTTKPVGRGTGQGLAIARAVVVDRHGGTIDFESEVGRGTVFIVRIPLTAAEASADSQDFAA